MHRATCATIAAALILTAGGCQPPPPVGGGARACRGGLPASFTSNFAVSPDFFGTRATITPQPGDTVQITATGEVNYGQTLGIGPGRKGPDGNPTEPAPEGPWWRFPGAPKYALFALWNKDLTRFVVGSSSECVVLGDGPNPAILFLQVNDEGDHRDNSGQFDAVIRIWR